MPLAAPEWTIKLHTWFGRVIPVVPCASHPPRAPMEPSGLTLASVLIATSGLFCLATLFFGTKGGYYDTDAYDGNGTAH